MSLQSKEETAREIKASFNRTFPILLTGVAVSLAGAFMVSGLGLALLVFGVEMCLCSALAAFESSLKLFLNELR